MQTPNKKNFISNILLHLNKICFSLLEIWLLSFGGKFGAVAEF
jgi:hypothetical protein